MKTFANNFGKMFKKINWEKVFNAGLSATFLYVSNKTAKALVSIGAAFENLTEGIADFGKGLGKNLAAEGIKKKAEALKMFAIAIAIMAASLIVLSFVPVDKLLTGAIALGVLVIALLAISKALEKFGGALLDFDASAKKVNFKNVGVRLIQIGAALLLMSFAVKVIGGMDTGSAVKGLLGLTYLVGLLVGF